MSWYVTCFLCGVGFNIVCLSVGVTGWTYLIILTAFAIGFVIAALASPRRTR